MLEGTPAAADPSGVHDGTAIDDATGVHCDGRGSGGVDSVQVNIVVVNSAHILLVIIIVIGMAIGVVARIRRVRG